MGKKALAAYKVALARAGSPLTTPYEQVVAQKWDPNQPRNEFGQFGGWDAANARMHRREEQTQHHETQAASQEAHQGARNEAIYQRGQARAARAQARAQREAHRAHLRSLRRSLRRARRRRR